MNTKRTIGIIVLALCAGCVGPRIKPADTHSSGIAKARDLISNAFKIDGKLLGTSVTFQDLAKPLNILGAMYGLPGAGDQIAAGDEMLLDVLGRKVAEAGASTSEQWGPTSILTNEYLAVEGLDPIPVDRVRGFYTVHTPIYPGARTNWIEFAAAKKQFAAGGAAAIAAKAKAAEAQAQALQLLASGVLSGDVKAALADALAKANQPPPASTSLVESVQTALGGVTNADWQTNSADSALDPAIQAVMPKP